MNGSARLPGSLALGSFSVLQTGGAFCCAREPRLSSRSAHTARPNPLSWLPANSVLAGYFLVRLESRPAQSKTPTVGIWTSSWLSREGKGTILEMSVLGDCPALRFCLFSLTRLMLSAFGPGWRPGCHLHIPFQQTQILWKMEPVVEEIQWLL